MFYLGGVIARVPTQDVDNTRKSGKRGSYTSFAQKKLNKVDFENMHVYL